MFSDITANKSFNGSLNKVLCVVVTGLFVIGFFPQNTRAQTPDNPFIGSWKGTLEAATDLRVVFHIERADEDSLTASMDAPDMGASGLPVSSVSVNGDSLTLKIDSINGQFEGVMTEAGTAIEGTWTEGGRSAPLILSPAGEQASLPSRYRQRPEADPADVKSPDAIVGAAYDVISVANKDTLDWDRLRSLFLPEARLIPTGRVEDGVATYFTFSVEEFIKRNKPRVQQLIENGFVEREIHAETQRFGDIAHVFSTYETIHTAKSPEPVDRGINSFQLWYDGKRWWIVNLMYHEERKGLPIPDRYEN